MLRPPPLSSRLVALVLSAVVGIGVSIGRHADAAPEPCNVADLWRSQQRIGKDRAELNIKEWQRYAKKRGVSLRTVAKELREKALRKVVPVFRAPDGALIPSDKHNGVWAYAKLQRKTGVRIAVSTELVHDGSGQTEEEFAHTFFQEHGKGRVDAKHEHKSDVEKMRILRQRKTAQLGNDTLRSTIDVALERLKLDGEMFTDYIEIDVGRYLRDNKIFKQLRDAKLLGKGDKEIPRKLVFKRGIIKLIAERLKEPEMKAYLIAHARTPDQVPIIEAALAD